MKILDIKMPKIHTDIITVLEKPGNRIEYALKLNEDLNAFGKEITNMPLQFASVIIAEPGEEDQLWHEDCDEGERAILYLSDVDEYGGAVEFNTGKVIGPSGTLIYYNANEMHRGCATNKKRAILAFAFSNVQKPFTIGTVNFSNVKMLTSTTGTFTLTDVAAMQSDDYIALLPIKNFFSQDNLLGFPNAENDKLFDGATLNINGTSKNYNTTKNNSNEFTNKLIKNEWSNDVVNVTFAQTTSTFALVLLNSSNTLTKIVIAEPLTGAVGPAVSNEPNLLIIIILIIFLISLPLFVKQ